MAKIKAGILSKVSGKVAGVVGGTWKGTNYLRELVKPANPNTPLQQAQRSQMRAVVRCARTLTGDVFKPYLDKFLKNMSGYNWFVKNNIKKFSGVSNTLASALAFSSGNLPTIDCTLTKTAGSEALGFGESNFVAPAGHSAKVVGIVYNDNTGLSKVGVADYDAQGGYCLNEDDLDGFWTAGDRLSYGTFLVDIDGNGVVQAIGTSTSYFETI